MSVWIKKSVLQVLDSANDELQGKMKNLVWCDLEQKVLSIAMPESYEFAEANAASRSFSKDGFPLFQNWLVEKVAFLLYRPIKAIKN